MVLTLRHTTTPLKNYSCNLLKSIHLNHFMLNYLVISFINWLLCMFVSFVLTFHTCVYIVGVILNFYILCMFVSFVLVFHTYVYIVGVILNYYILCMFVSFVLAFHTCVYIIGVVMNYYIDMYCFLKSCNLWFTFNDSCLSLEQDINQFFVFWYEFPMSNMSCFYQFSCY